MLRGLLLLIVLVVLIAVVWRLFRRSTDEAPRIPSQASLPPPRKPGEIEIDATFGSEADLTHTAPAPSNVQGFTPIEVFTKLHELGFGVSLLAPAVSAEHSAVVAAASTTLDDIVTEPRYAPRRPMLLPQLLRAVNDDEVSRRELANIIAKDPSLTGNLLKLANSSFYRSVDAQPIESVDRAVAMLGTNGIRSLIAAALIQPVFRLTGQKYAKFPEVTWDHTLRSATAAEAHAALVENSDPFAAQLLALLMGLSEIMIFRVMIDQYAAKPELIPDPAVIAALLDARTADIARRIAASWELSGRILAAFEDQTPGIGMHQPTSLGRSLAAGRLLGALAQLRASSLVTDEQAQATMLANGSSASQFERMWTRLTGRPAPGSSKPTARAPSLPRGKT